MLRGKRRAALFIARGYIECSQEEFICHALIRAARQYPELREAALSINTDISNVLEGYGALGVWQQCKGWRNRPEWQRRLDRLAWIDWMVENWK